MLILCSKLKICWILKFSYHIGAQIEGVSTQNQMPGAIVPISDLIRCSNLIKDLSAEKISSKSYTKDINLCSKFKISGILKILCLKTWSCGCAKWRKSCWESHFKENISSLDLIRSEYGYVGAQIWGYLIKALHVFFLDANACSKFKI